MQAYAIERSPVNNLLTELLLVGNETLIFDVKGSMKIRIFLSLMACFYVTQAQVTTQKKSLEKSVSPQTPTEPLKIRPEISLIDLQERLPSADRYILDIKSLMNYFIDKKIPTDFPSYNTEKSFAFNKRKALRWFKKHTDLITEERKKMLNIPSK